MGLKEKIRNLIPDRLYVPYVYSRRMGKRMSLKNPVGFNEKLQWLKVYNKNPAYTQMVDKHAVKAYVADLIGEEYIIPTLGVWDRFEDINFDELPEQFVLKCTHDSGGLCICTDKSKFDIEAARAKINASLARNYYWECGREWPYKNVPPRIIAEQYMIDSTTEELRDYKFFCFDGRVDCVMVCLDRATGDTKFYFFNREWELLRYNKRGLAAPEGFSIPKPANMDEMFDIAERLSQNLPFARIDLYSVEDKTYFGEITFFSDGGYDANILPETDARWGEMIKIKK